MRSDARSKRNRIRKSTKITYTLTALIILILSLFSFLGNLKKDSTKTSNKQIYAYTNKFNYNYQVNLLKNKYIQAENQSNQLAYVTSLIDTTDLNLNYKYEADKITNIKGTYSVVGRMEVIYTRDGEEQKIWSEEDKLLEEKQIEQKTNIIEIKESLNIDLKDKNKILEEFKQQMGMTVEAKYSIILDLKLNTEVEEKKVEIKQSPRVQIELANKTTKIMGENNKEETEYISKQYSELRNQSAVINIISFVGIILSIIALRRTSKLKVAHIVRNGYRQELNRILKLCEDKIVKVSTKPVITGEKVIEVKDFGEIFKVSEELFKPIVHYYDNIKEEAYFYIMTDSIVYQYKLRK